MCCFHFHFEYVQLNVQHKIYVPVDDWLLLLGLLGGRQRDLFAHLRLHKRKPPTLKKVSAKKLLPPFPGRRLPGIHGQGEAQVHLLKLQFEEEATAQTTPLARSSLNQ